MDNFIPIIIYLVLIVLAILACLAIHAIIVLIDTVLQTSWGRPIENHVYMTFTALFLCFYLWLSYFSFDSAYEYISECWILCGFWSIAAISSIGMCWMLLDLIWKGYRRIQTETFQHFRHTAYLWRLRREISNS